MPNVVYISQTDDVLDYPLPIHHSHLCRPGVIMVGIESDDQKH
jgi:hypothetical protein